MGEFFTAILAKIAAFAGWIASLVTVIFAALWTFSTDLGAWFVDQCLGLVVKILDSVEFNADLFNPGNYIASLPADVTNILGLLHIGECMAIIGGACVIKLMLQLIPFTRLGS